MAIVINNTPDTGYKYIPQAEKNSENPFAVWIKPLASRNLLDLEDRMVQRQEGNVFIAQGLFSFRVVQQGLLNWENMLDHNGKPIDCVIGLDKVASEQTVAHIPADLITEIANVLNAITRDPANIQIFFPED
jgi:hypothetical protein